ncbi:Plasma membrane permease, mediates uptake of glycerophosphoinositol and glycerophosphocholine [Pestalotiopsis sp. IQ-011]
MSSTYLVLPPIDTSLGLFDSDVVNSGSRRKPLPRIDTAIRPPSQDIPEEVIASAAEAVAEALGVSLSEIPETRAIISRPEPEPRRPSSFYPPQPDFTWSTPAQETSIERRLSIALAETLGIESGTIPRDESFVDLGGDKRAAIALRAKCLKAGLSVQTKDILSSRTIAELETHITPFSPSPLTSRTADLPLTGLVSPLHLSSPLATVSPGTRPTTAAAAAAQRRRSASSSEAQTPIVPRAHLKPKSSKRYHNQVEQCLSLNGEVAKASVLKPKAGLFEGQVTAFLTLSSCVVEGPNTDEIKLLNAYYTIPLPSIRKAVEAKVSPNVVPKVWIVLEQMPLDENGKIQRRKLQTWIQNANEDLYHKIMSIDSQDRSEPPESDNEKRLQKAVGKVLNLDTEQIGMNLSFSSLGGDQTTAMQLVVRCKSQGLSFKVEDILQDMPLVQLAAMATPSEIFTDKTSEDATQGFDLSPMQRLYFHTAMGQRAPLRADKKNSYRFNQSILLRFRRPMAVEDVRAAVEAVVGHHSMLRTRFRTRLGSWSQYTLTEIPSSHHFGHHTVGTNTQVGTIIQQAQISIDIENGPVFAAHHFHTHDGHQLLYLVAHHLVTDLKSWRVMIDDLQELMMNGSLVSGRRITFPEWTAHQRRLVEGMESPTKLPFTASAADLDYWGVNDLSNKYGNTATLAFTLEPEITSALDASNRALRTDSSDLFMAALLLSFSQTFRDRPTPSIWNQEHERAVLDSEIDLSETVGWFTALCPIGLQVAPTDEISDVLARVKDARRSKEGRGVPFFASNMLSAESADSFAASYCPAEIIFTYAGSMESLDSQKHLLEQISVPGPLTSSTSDIGPNVGRISLFEVSAAIDHGEARFKLLYNKWSRHEDLIKAWVRSYETLVRETIQRLQSRAPELSMSDIPLMDMTYDDLTRLNRDILPNLGIEIANIENMYPVTANQQDLLISEPLNPGSSRSQTVYELNTHGKFVDIGLLCAAWQQVVQKHPALRTVFMESVSRLGLFDQIVLRRHSPNMLFIENDRPDTALYSMEKLAPINLMKGTPWHRLVVCQAPGKTLLMLEVSQALCDASSITILFSELQEVYFGHALPNTTDVHYPEYLQCLKTTPVSIEFWRELLHGVQPCHFPSLISKSLDTRAYEHSFVDLGVAHEDLEAFAEKYKLDVAAVLRVAWALVLRAYVGSDSACFAYRTSGRDIPVDNLSDAVGCFSTEMICRLDVHSSQFLAQLLLDSAEIHQEALHHQHVSVNSVHHALETKGRRLFNTCLSFGYEYIAEEPAVGVKFRHVRNMQASEYDINIDVVFKNGTVVIDLGHRILTSEQACHVGHAFGRAISAILEVTGGQVKEVDLFSEHDHQQILAWNGQPKIAPSKEHVHELIAKNAIEHPDIQAVSAWDGGFSYAELDKMSMILAGALSQAGVKHQTPVPIIMDKSRWVVPAMLAVLNIGACIVPVDTALPSIFSWVIKSVGAKIALASESVRKHLKDVNCELVFINEETIASLPEEPTLVTSARTEEDDVACILFNSDVVQTRKGITYSHSALATACVGQGPALRINPSSRVMHYSSYSSDVALAEIFTTLTNGACVCIGKSVKATEFSTVAQRMNVNWTYLTPTLSRRLTPESMPDMAIVCFRTHQLDDDVYSQWAGRAKIILAYGSPESCVLGLSASEVRDAFAVRGVGSPYCGNFWVVNPSDSNKLMPIGAVGELVIAAPTLAIGRDLDAGPIQLNKKKAGAGGGGRSSRSGRLLKTGHYARYVEHGQLELVSARSEKVDLGDVTMHTADIERKLRRCLGRSIDVAVTKIAFNYTDSDSAPIIAAFIELDDELFHGEDLSRLQPQTKERLYLAKQMAGLSLRGALPDTFVPVRQLPLTPLYEVSHRELQKMIRGLSKTQLLGLAQVPNPQEVNAAGLELLPLTATEQRMRSLWQEVLGLHASPVRPTDGFMSLGGDLDLAHDLVVECRKQDVSISILDVVRDMSLAELCRGVSMPDSPIYHAEQSRYMQPSPSNAFVDDAIVPQIGDRDSIEDIAEASATQTMFLEGMLSSRPGNVNYFLVNVNGPLDWGKLENACYLLTMAHPILRTAFVSHNRQLFQTVIRTYHPEFQRYQSNGWRLGGLAAKVIKRDQMMPVDFRQPATKFWYIDALKQSVLVMRLSRAQYNDQTLPTLVSDLSRFYEQGDLPTPRPGFCDVVRATQRCSLGGAVDYWKALLDGSSMTEVITKSGPDVPTSKADSKTVQQVIPTGSLNNLGIPFETILKGAWSIVLSNLSGSEDVVFGESRSGTFPGLSDAVGPLVRTTIPSVPTSPLEFLRNVQNQHITSTSPEHENMQWSEIVKKCTKWPIWKKFSTVVEHDNQIDRDGINSFNIGSAACRLGRIESNHQNTDIFVSSSTSGSTHVNISLTFSEKKILPFFVQEVLSMLCSTISLLTSAFIMEPISLRGLHDNGSTSRIPLPVMRRDVQFAAPVISVSPDKASAVHAIITSSWNSILGTLGVADDLRAVPFYQFTSSLVPAAELARYFTDSMPRLNLPGLAHATFTLEDILENPTMMKQYEMIIARQQVPQLKRSQSFVHTVRRRLTVAGGPTSPGPNPSPGRKTRGGSAGSSMESMTTGSSQSDEEHYDEVPEMVPPQHRRRAVAKPFEVKKRSSMLFGKMKLSSTGA